VTEWQVVSVIVVLVGLAASIVKPIVALNSSITRLTELVGFLDKRLAEMSEKNNETHEKMWKRAGEQETHLQNHETRLAVLESERG
jgi:hypothetical protein